MLRKLVVVVSFLAFFIPVLGIAAEEHAGGKEGEKARAEKTDAPKDNADLLHEAISACMTGRAGGPAPIDGSRPKDPQASSDGSAIWAAKCQSCHSEGGKGPAIAKWTGNWEKALPRMPQDGTKLNPTEIAAVAAYLKTLPEVAKLTK